MVVRRHCIPKIKKTVGYENISVLQQAVAGSYTFTPEQDGLYTLTLVGGGAGGAYNTSDNRSSAASGGSGAGCQLRAYLKGGVTYTVNVGKGGAKSGWLDASTTGGAGGVTTLSVDDTVLITAYGGKGGSVWWPNGQSAGGVTAICNIVTTTDYLKIDSVVFNKQGASGGVGTTSGGASVISGTTYGQGGNSTKAGTASNGTNGYDGYVEVIYKQEIETGDDETVEKSYVVKRNYKEYYKFGGRIPNVNVVGDSTISANGLTRVTWYDEYFALPHKFNPENNTWEMVFHAQTPNYYYDVQYLLGQSARGERGCQIYLKKSGVWGINLSSDGINWDIANNVETSETYLTTNKYYFLKLSWDGSTYKLEISSDSGKTFSTVISVSSTTPVVSGENLILCNNMEIDNTSIYWGGYIYPKDCYIKINDKFWWKGMKSNYKDVPFTFPELTSEGSLGGDECGIQPLSDTITDLMNMFQPLVDDKPANGVYTTFQNTRDEFVIYSPEAFKISKMEYYYGREEDGTFEPKKNLTSFIYGSNNGEDWEELYYYHYPDNKGENDDVYSFNNSIPPYKYYRISFNNTVKIGKIIISGYIEERLTKDDDYAFYEKRRKTYIPNRQIAYNLTFNVMPDNATIGIKEV